MARGEGAGVLIEDFHVAHFNVDSGLTAILREWSHLYEFVAMIERLAWLFVSFEERIAF